MILTPSAGPVGAPTSPDGLGFLSSTSVRYELELGAAHEQSLPLIDGVEDPRGHCIQAGDVLRFYVHPVLDPALSWGATFVALDLVLDDGTRLSALPVQDQYGTIFRAENMGAAKILYADQWNDVQVDLSAAAGRTVTDVLVVGAAPSAPTGDASETDAGPASAQPLPAEPVHGFLDGPWIGPLPDDPPADDLVAWVDTRRGTNASGDFSRGNNLPLTAWPNGFCFLTPATDARSHRWIYEYHRANDAENRPRLQGLGFSHQPSPWMGDRNQVMFMPLRGENPSGDPSARSLPFDHAEEIARPDLYRVRLDGALTLSAAPTDHGAVIEIQNDTPDEALHLLIDGAEDALRIDGAGAVLDGEVRGWVDSRLARGDEDADGATRMFLLAQMEPAPITVGNAEGALPGACRLSFAPGTTTVTIRVVTSFIGIDQARRTFAQEVEARTLAQVQQAAHAAWSERLSVITVPQATPPQRRTLYGNLYRLNLYPNSQWENAGTAERPEPVHASPVLPVRAEATDTRTNAQILPGRLYVNNGFWDTYRTAWPAYALLYPRLAAELADGFVQQFREGGWIARWSSPGYADCMTGTSSDIAFADLQVKGVELPDPLGTYRSGLRNATTTAPCTQVGRKGNDTAVFTGYVDTETEESVSWALEACINDAGLAAQAALLAEDPSLPQPLRETLCEEAEYFRFRSLNYTLLFDPQIRFFQGRRRDGSFAQSPEEFDPCAWGGDFTETCGWNFAFHVPHDGEGLAALYGGRDALRATLEEFFATPERADKRGTYGSVIHEMLEARAVRMGQFGVSNQPAHHIPFLFHHAGAPHRAGQVVREVHRRLFVGEQIGQGYPGDEDNGEMSAWWLLTALGLYPLQLGTTRYHLVPPLFERAEVRPLHGPAFTVIAEGQAPEACCIQAVTAGGRAVDDACLDHGDLAGQIRFELAAEPGEWGRAPSSLTPETESPRPLQDLLPREAHNPLVDDTSRTEASFPEASAVIDLPAPLRPDVPLFYTLTSGAEEGGDPIAWSLEGSDDAATWTVLDERTEQAFPWRLQTRPFRLSGEQAYARYRLVVRTATGPLRLTQVELLA